MSAKPYLCAFVGAVIGCTGITAAQAKTIPVVASFSVLANVVKEVGGDHVEVKSLVPPEGDPHEYQPSPQDSAALKAASVTFISGDSLEGWFKRLVDASGAENPVVIASKGIKTHTMEEDGETVTDPHVWNSVPNAKIWVKNIEAALVKADPEDAKDIKKSAAAYLKQLDDLDAYIKTKLAPIPVDHRKVLTSHDAFGYFGEAYNVSFMSPLGVSTDSEASAQDVAKLIDQIKANHITTYFIENSNDGRLVEQIGKATGAQPGGELYPESLSKADGPVPTYIAMMKYNTDLIAAALSHTK